MATTHRVFISYSRKDYYFAESLAFHLLQRDIGAWLDAKDLSPGVDWLEGIEAAIDAASCLLLVVSPASLHSETVRREFQRAQRQGKRIIAVLFRQRTVPAAWGITEVVDFRGAFEPTLNELTARLGSTSAGQATSTHAVRRPLLRFPPWVSVTALCLLWPLLLLFSVSWLYPEFFLDVYDSLQAYNRNMAGAGPELRHVLGERSYHAFYLGLFAVMFGLVMHYSVLEFVYRRMSMTRLALAFAFMLYFFGYTLLQLWLGPAMPPLTPGFIMRGFEARWPASLWVLLSVICAGGAGLGIVLLKRPGDLLRWTPTGYAWLTYRWAYAPAAEGAGHDARHSLNTLTSFRLLHDSRDTPLAERLRRLLRAAGAVETPDGGKGGTPIVVLTNCSGIGWIERQVEAVRGDVLTLLSTHLSPPDTLAWLWRFQWIDFRTWDARRLTYRQTILPSIPEALLQPRYPAAVRRTHHGLCALGALVFHVFSTGFHAVPSPQGTLLLGPVGTPVTSILAVLVILFSG